MPPMQPQNPDPKYNFILDDQRQAKRPLGLPRLPKPALIGLGLVGALLIVIILASVLGKPSTNTTAVSGVLARGAEVQRVTTKVQQLNLQDPATQALAATVSATLSSSQTQLEQYLAANHTNVSDAQLAADTDKSTDSQIQSASQNNSLDQAYIAYLSQSLLWYRSDIQMAYNTAGPNGKAILKNFSDGVNTLLSAAPLRGANLVCGDYFPPANCLVK